MERSLDSYFSFQVPIVFVMMGIQVRVETFSNLPILGLAAGLTLAAIVGKQICELGVLDRCVDRLSIGVGMIPRGESRSHFREHWQAIKVINDAAFSAVVIMVIIATLITPPIMKWALGRQKE
jgi:Kef-type K+ transport system membrane component KefB